MNKKNIPLKISNYFKLIIVFIFLSFFLFGCNFSTLIISLLLTNSNQFSKSTNSNLVKISSPSPQITSPIINGSTYPIPTPSSSDTTTDNNIFPVEIDIILPDGYTQNIQFDEKKDNTFLLTAIVKLSNGKTNNKVVWESLNPDIATISQNGLVKILKTGKVKIIAKSSQDNKIQKSIEITITSSTEIQLNTPTPLPSSSDKEIELIID